MNPIGTSPFHLRAACRQLRSGGIIAYPTEAVYGLGCDPNAPLAVARLLALKRRSSAKGLILVAADVMQLAPYILPLSPALAARVLPAWPGPMTWLLPAALEVAPWLTGSRETIAARVSAHPLVQALCSAYGGAIVSTSANLSGGPAACSPLAVRKIFGDKLDYVLHGPLGGRKRPTEIRDARTGTVVRAG